MLYGGWGLFSGPEGGGSFARGDEDTGVEVAVVVGWYEEALYFSLGGAGESRFDGGFDGGESLGEEL